MSDLLGPLVVDIKGMVVEPEEKELINHPLVGGVILFTRNYDSKQQLKELITALRRSCKRPLLVMVDHEGGRVQRFLRDLTLIPSMGSFGQLYDRDFKFALSKVQDCGWLVAQELLEVGIDFNLAPILDLNKGISAVIGERAFHQSSVGVIALARAFIRGMSEAGMAAVGKHFPGHGSIAIDSHRALPVDDRSYDMIFKDDLQPFIAMITEGMPAIMAAHILFPLIDTVPVSYSPKWLKKILREELLFQGIVISDDLNMEAARISESFSDCYKEARYAGCDLVVLCNNRSGVIQILDEVGTNDTGIAFERWYALHAKRKEAIHLINHPRWKTTADFLHRFATSSAKDTTYR